MTKSQASNFKKNEDFVQTSSSSFAAFSQFALAPKQKILIASHWQFAKHNSFQLKLRKLIPGAAFEPLAKNSLTVTNELHDLKLNSYWKPYDGAKIPEELWRIRAYNLAAAAVKQKLRSPKSTLKDDSGISFSETGRQIFCAGKSGEIFQDSLPDIGKQETFAAATRMFQFPYRVCSSPSMTV